MKKIISSVLLFSLLFCLFGCQKKLLDDKTANDYVDATKYVDSGRSATLSCELLESGKYSINVKAENAAETLYTISVSSGTLITDADGNTLKLEDLTVGSMLLIIYDGNVMETYPARISKCYKIQVLSVPDHDVE